MLQHGVQSPDPRLQLRYGVLDSEFVAAANAHAEEPQYDQHDPDGPFDAVSQAVSEDVQRLPMFGSRFYFVAPTCLQFAHGHCDDGRMRTLKFVFTVGVALSVRRF